jgi:hypothetical protein
MAQWAGPSRNTSGRRGSTDIHILYSSWVCMSLLLPSPRDIGFQILYPLHGFKPVTSQGFSRPSASDWGCITAPLPLVLRFSVSFSSYWFPQPSRLKKTMWVFQPLIVGANILNPSYNYTHSCWCWTSGEIWHIQADIGTSGSDILAHSVCSNKNIRYIYA